MSEPNSICLFSSLYLPSMGGVETYTASLARALANLNMRVAVVTCNTHGLPERANDDGIEIVRLPCRSFLGGRYPAPLKSASRKLRVWLKGQHFQAMVVNTRFYPLSAQALAFAQECNVMPVLIEHGSAHLTMGNAVIDKGVEAVEHTMTTRCLRHPAAYYAVSRRASAWLGHFGIASQGELPNSIDADAYVAQASDRDYRSELGLIAESLLVASVGRWVPEKGVRALAEAALMLKDSPITIALAGEGPLADELQVAAQQSNGHLKLLGRIDRKDVAALLTQADLMCLPSRSEGFATTLLEAAACGTPSLVTPVGGTDELIPDSSYGTILPDAAPQTVTHALRKATESRENLRVMGKNAARLVRSEFSWDKTAQRVVKACSRAQESR